MLQQTQVATVISYFERFVGTLPTIESLARADEQLVLKLWEGLGYYRRARQLHQAAQQIVTDHGGQFPQQFDAVRALPGIGRYTAGAILSIAFEQRQPILEANTIRLFSRLSAYADDPTKTAGQRYLWHVAEQLLPRSGFGEFNQALMELGSVVCTPRQPSCTNCPLERICRTAAAGLQAEIPATKKKVSYEEIHEAAIVVQRNGRVLVRKCRDDERWAGLWDFPRFQYLETNATAARGQLIDELANLTGLHAQLGPAWTTIKHGVTRFRITLSCFEATKITGRLRRNGQQWRWLKPAELADYPLSVTGRKIGRLWTARHK